MFFCMHRRKTCNSKWFLRLWTKFTIKLKTKYFHNCILNDDSENCFLIVAGDETSSMRKENCFLIVAGDETSSMRNSSMRKRLASVSLTSPSKSWRWHGLVSLLLVDFLVEALCSHLDAGVDVKVVRSMHLPTDKSVLQDVLKDFLARTVRTDLCLLVSSVFWSNNPFLLSLKPLLVSMFYCL